MFLYFYNYFISFGGEVNVFGVEASPPVDKNMASRTYYELVL